MVANKRTTLKMQTGNNIYPNVVKENLPASAVFYDAEGAVGANCTAKADNCRRH